METTVLEALLDLEETAAQVVRPKEGPGKQRPAEKTEARLGESGEWWLGQPGTGDYRSFSPPASLLTPSGTHFTQWHECRILDDDDWSYSTAVGTQTIEVLREMFGVAGFRPQGHGRDW